MGKAPDDSAFAHSLLVGAGLFPSVFLVGSQLRYSFSPLISSAGGPDSPLSAPQEVEGPKTPMSVRGCRGGVEGGRSTTDWACIMRCGGCVQAALTRRDRRRAGGTCEAVPERCAGHHPSTSCIRACWGEGTTLCTTSKQELLVACKKSGGKKSQRANFFWRG